MVFEQFACFPVADLAKARSYRLAVSADEVVNLKHVGYRAYVICRGVEQLLSVTPGSAQRYSVHKRHKWRFFDIGFTGYQVAGNADHHLADLQSKSPGDDGMPGLMDRSPSALINWTHCCSICRARGLALLRC